MRKMRICMIAILLIFLSLILGQSVSANEDTKKDLTSYYTDINYDEVQDVLGEVLSKEEGFNFSEYVTNLITGEKSFTLTNIINDILSAVKEELKFHKNTLFRLISIALIAAVFTNFTNIFQNNQVAETGFYITYLLLFSILTASFLIVTTVAADTINNLLLFMKALIPTFFLTVAFSAGADTSLIFYESTIIMITLADYILVGFVLPAINIYFILSLANNLSKEDMLSKLTELLELVIQWTLKTLFGAVVGFNAIQGLIVPVVNHVKNSLVLKAATAIPGIGNALGTATETVLSAGVLVKNAIGVAGLLVILTICSIPLIKLVFYVLIYKLGVAVIQPISDKRIMNCMNASASAAKLLLHTVFIGMILFLFTIAVIAASTNLRLG